MQNDIPTNVNQELNQVHHEDRAKVEKTLKGTKSNFKYEKDHNHHHIDHHKKGWKDSRGYKGKNFADRQRIEYIKEKKKQQSEHDKQLNIEHPERNIKAEKEKIVKNDEKQVFSRGHNTGGRRNH